MRPRIRQNRKLPLFPWKMNKSRFIILEEYDAKVVSDEGKYYGIEFNDNDSTPVEARMLKTEFKYLPCNVRPGTEFFILIYRLKGRLKPRLSVWPVAKYCHPSWLMPLEKTDCKTH